MDFPFFKWTIHIGRARRVAAPIEPSAPWPHETAEPLPAAAVEEAAPQFETLSAPAEPTVTVAAAEPEPQFQPYYQSEPVAEPSAALIQEAQSLAAPADANAEAAKKRTHKSGNALWVLRMLASGSTGLDGLEGLAEITGNLQRKNVRWAVRECRDNGWITGDQQCWTLTESGRMRGADDRLVWHKNAKPRPVMVAELPVEPVVESTSAVIPDEPKPVRAPEPVDDRGLVYAQRARDSILFGADTMAARLMIRFEPIIKDFRKVCDASAARVHAIDDMKLWTVLYGAYGKFLFQEHFFVGLLAFYGLRDHVSQETITAEELHAYQYIKFCVGKYDSERGQGSLAA